MTRNRNLVVVGASYVGAGLGQKLAKAFHASHQVIVVEANTHFEHLFVTPRFSLPALHGRAQEAFIPYSGAWADCPPDSGRIIRARVTSIDPSARTVTLDRPAEPFGTSLSYDYLALATGTRDPDVASTSPADPKYHALSKWVGVHALEKQQDAIDRAQHVVLVGAGATGVQMALDIKEVYPLKRVTLIHSRDRLMSRFHPALGELTRKRAEELGVELVLGERVKSQDGRTVELMSGRRIEADHVISTTGSPPANRLVKAIDPSAIDPATGYIVIEPTLQLRSQIKGSDRVFVLGDVAHTGAGKAARPAAVQSDVVTRNIGRLIAGESDTSLEQYRPDPPAIHLSLGITANVVHRDATPDAPTWRTDGTLDMGIEGMWTRLGIPIEGRDYHL